MSPKNIAKDVKVVFQSLLWDPPRHRILSPSMNSKLEACFALGDTVGLENSPQSWIQEDNQQFTKELDAKTTNGILQKQAVAHANPPLGDLKPAFEERCCSEPGLAFLVGLDSSSSPETLGSLENQRASLGRMSGSYSLDIP